MLPNPARPFGRGLEAQAKKWSSVTLQARLAFPSTPRMELPVDCLEAFTIDVGVLLRRADI
jgi:hypothetical protein